VITAIRPEGGSAKGGAKPAGPDKGR
jgi:hypothetical protein